MSGREGEEEQSYGRLRKTDKSNCGRALSTYDSGSGPRIAASSAAMQLTGWEWLTCLPNHFHWKTYIQHLPICLRDSASNMHRWRWTDSRTFFFNFLQQRMCCGSSSSWVVISFGAKHQVIVSIFCFIVGILYFFLCHGPVPFPIDLYVRTSLSSSTLLVRDSSKYLLCS